MYISFYRQYLQTDRIVLPVPPIIHQQFLKSLIEDYKLLLQERYRDPVGLLATPKTLIFEFEHHEADDRSEDFDITFVAYLVLFKVDLPNLTIQLRFPQGHSLQKKGHFYQLAQHRLHLLITGGQSYFTIYEGETEYRGKIERSDAYIPPLLINERTLGTLFTRKAKSNNYRSVLHDLLEIPTVRYMAINDRKDVLDGMLNGFRKMKGPLRNWRSADLSMLYLIRTLYDLYILRHLVYESRNERNDYQIGPSIVSGKGDEESTFLFREMVLQKLEDNQVFDFCEVEAYFFSILIQNSRLFQVPESDAEMWKLISPHIPAGEKEAVKKDKRLRRRWYIDTYRFNLQKVINYARDIAYGLKELSKNIAEHTTQGHGVVTARIYDMARIVNLKKVDKEWLRRFQVSHRFLDINVVDSGTTGIKETYQSNLEKEKAAYQLTLPDSKLKSELLKGYEDDIQVIGQYDLHQFFYFNSVKLYHQINRTKAHFGLLIFAQTILNEKRAYAHLSSNNLYDNRPEGFYLFEKDGQIEERVSNHFLSVGTNYNFIVPVNEVYEYEPARPSGLNGESSPSASVFLELQQAYFGSAQLLQTISFEPGGFKMDKYLKLDQLKEQVFTQAGDRIPLIDAADLQRYLLNSSDWVRFLANLQLGSSVQKDIIVAGLPPDTYLEIIAILKIFDYAAAGEIGFWQNGRFVLFFLPVAYEGRLFWFNSLLTGRHYQYFLQLNREIDRYHLNLSRILKTEEQLDLPTDTPEPDLNSRMFSSSKKLLNFELVISTKEHLSLFEETTQSLIYIPINSQLDGN